MFDTGGIVEQVGHNERDVREQIGARSSQAIRQVVQMAISIAGLMMCIFIGQIVGIILGYKARKQIEESHGRITGEGLATAGIIIGWVGLALDALIVVSVVIIAGMAILAHKRFLSEYEEKVVTPRRLHEQAPNQEPVASDGRFAERRIVGSTLQIDAEQCQKLPIDAIIALWRYLRDFEGPRC